MIVVSDTSPITALLSVGQAELLEMLYGEVRRPQSVAEELLAFHASLPDFIQISVAEKCTLLEQLKIQFDPGEAEAIVLTRQLHADLLLIDEALGREAARKEHLPVIGLMGVLLIAKKKGLIPSVTTLIDQLETHAGFYLSRQVKEKVILSAGE